jgi:hypothetical protein
MPRLATRPDHLADAVPNGRVAVENRKLRCMHGATAQNGRDSADYYELASTRGCGNPRAGGCMLERENCRKYKEGRVLDGSSL